MSKNQKANVSAQPTYNRASFGQDGYKHLVFGGTAVATLKDGYTSTVVVALTDATVTKVNASGDNLTSAVLSAGTPIDGCATSITVEAGEVLVYANAPVDVAFE